MARAGPVGSGVGVGDGPVVVQIVNAVDDVADGANTARVEADDVEALVEVGPALDEAGLEEPGAGAPGSAGVDDERADAIGRVGGGPAHEAELDGPRGRAAVVEGDGHRRAFVALVTRLPVEGGVCIRRRGGGGKPGLGTPGCPLGEASGEEEGSTKGECRCEGAKGHRHLLKDRLRS